MKTLLLLLAAASVSQAATTLSFSGIRYDQTGTVSGGTSPSFTFDSKANNNTPAHSSTFTVTGDFDGDTTTESFSFTLTATATSGNAQSNAAGYVGVGSPRIDNGQELTYSIAVPTTFALSGGGTGSVNFGGFTGGNMNGGDDYDVNGTTFTSASTFTAANTTTMTITSRTNSMFVTGIKFNMDVIPEPSSTALLALAGMAFLSRRKR